MSVKTQFTGEKHQTQRRAGTRHGSMAAQKSVSPCTRGGSHRLDEAPPRHREPTRGPSKVPEMQRGAQPTARFLHPLSAAALTSPGQAAMRAGSSRAQGRPHAASPRRQPRPPGPPRPAPSRAQPRQGPARPPPRRGGSLKPRREGPRCLGAAGEARGAGP